LPTLDFVSVQFYNNPSCNLGTSGFLPSLQAWSQDVSKYSTWNSVGNGFTGPRLLIGAPGGAGGYVGQDAWRGILQQVKALRLGNLGGAMFWDGSYLEVNKLNGKTMADVVRDVL
jgi:chitinase